MSGLASGVRSVLPKEAPPRVLSGAETKRHGPVTIAPPSAYWTREGKAAREAETPKVPGEQEGRGLDTSTPNRTRGGGTRVGGSGCWLFRQVAPPQCENV